MIGVLNSVLYFVSMQIIKVGVWYHRALFALLFRVPESLLVVEALNVSIINSCNDYIMHIRTWLADASKYPLVPGRKACSESGSYRYVPAEVLRCCSCNIHSQIFFVPVHIYIPT